LNIIRTKEEIENLLLLSKKVDSTLPEFSSFGDYNYYITDILEEALSPLSLESEEDFLSREGWEDADVYTVLSWLDGDDSDLESNLREG